MLKRRSLVLVLSVLAAFVAVAVAGAANRGVLLDPVGDSGSAPDITRVEIEEYSLPLSWGGTSIQFTATFAGELRCTSDGDGVPMVVAVDADQNPDTGSAFYGTEYEFAPDAIGDAMFLRADGWDFRAVRYRGLSWSCGPHTAGYGVDASALGLAPGDGFNVVVAVLGPHTDTAPDIRTFNYQPVAGRQPPPLGPDRRPPHLIAYATEARRGKVAQLRYWVLDGRGRTAEVIRIYKKTKLLKTIRRPLRDSNPFVVSVVRWQVPKTVHGRLRFSVDATDAAGNHSTRRWAWLVVR